MVKAAVCPSSGDLPQGDKTLINKSMFYVYGLQSLKVKDWLYIGFSENLKERIKKHNEGKVKSTTNYRPLRLIYYEAYLNKNDAIKREYELKHNSQQKEFLKERIKNSLAATYPSG